MSDTNEDESVIKHFQMVTGIDNLDVCRGILNQVGYDLNRAIEAVIEDCQHQRLSRNARMPSEREALMREQEEAYERSLRIDREKEVQRAEKKKQQEEDMLRLMREQTIVDARMTLANEILPAEPTLDNQNTFVLRFRLPRGECVDRKFSRTDTLTVIFLFADTLGMFKEKYSFWINTSPRVDLTTLNTRRTLEDAGLHRRDVIIIEEK